MNPPSEQLLSYATAALAAVGCVALVIEERLRPARWLRRGFALLLAAASVFSYYEFFSIPAPAFFHRWEMFHYVLGAKYADELGYERLYECVALADAENGHRAEVSARTIRDLRDDSLLEAGEVLREPRRCQRHFAPARWHGFRRDVALFRSLGDRRVWEQMQTDHGYNPSPIWTLVGRPLANLRPVSAASLRQLAWIDPILMAGSLVLLGWGFGWRVAWLACVFWSTQAPSSFAWTGGAFLRQDWLCLAIAALVCARKRHFHLAGACLIWSALLRVFPVLFFGGPLLLAAHGLVERRGIVPELKRFFAGAAIGCGLLLGASALSGATFETYRDFGAHVYMHSRTPITNHMSLRALLSFAPEDRIAQLERSDRADDQHWSEARNARLAARRPLYLAAVLLCLFAFARCVMSLHTLWIAIGLSLLLVLALTDPSSYYFSMVVLTAPLARARRSLEVLLLGLAAASQLLMLNLRYVDERYVALSALYLAFALALVALFSRPHTQRPA